MSRVFIYSWRPGILVRWLKTAEVLVRRFPSTSSHGSNVPNVPFKDTHLHRGPFFLVGVRRGLQQLCSRFFSWSSSCWSHPCLLLSYNVRWLQGPPRLISPKLRPHATRYMKMQPCKLSEDTRTAVIMQAFGVDLKSLRARAMQMPTKNSQPLRNKMKVVIAKIKMHAYPKFCKPSVRDQNPFPQSRCLPNWGSRGAGPTLRDQQIPLRCWSPNLDPLQLRSTLFKLCKSIDSIPSSYVSPCLIAEAWTPTATPWR